MLGTKWQSVTGRLRQVVFAPNYVTLSIKTILLQISVGQAGVWGVSPRNEVTAETINGLFAEKIKCV